PLPVPPFSKPFLPRLTARRCAGTLPFGYRTLRLCTDDDHPARRDFRGARRSDPARHSRPPGEGRGYSHRAGCSVQDEPAGDFQTPEGAGESQAHLAGSGCAAAAVPHRGQTACRSQRVVGEVPRTLGGQFRATRRPAGRTENREEETQEELTEDEDEERDESC